MTSHAVESAKRSSLLEGQRRILDRIASGAPLEETLETIVRLIEEQAEGMRCAVLLPDPGGHRLRFVAAPHLPDDYKAGIEPYLRIAPNMATSGTAAFLRRPVYIRGTATDPLWENCGAHIAARNGLRAIWAAPILSGSNTVLGTFAMYYGEPQLPAEEHIQLIDMATQLARVAIEGKCDEMLRSLFEGASTGILITDLAGVVLQVNRTFARMLGYTPAELHGRNIADITQETHNPALIEELLSLGPQEIANDRRYLSKSGAILEVRERSALRRDAAGVPRYVLTTVEKMTEAGSNPLPRLSQREREVLELVTAGRTSKEIASSLGISAASVDTYRSRLMQKLSIDDLPGLVRFAIRHGIATV